MHFEEYTVYVWMHQYIWKYMDTHTYIYIYIQRNKYIYIYIFTHVEKPVTL